MQDGNFICDGPVFPDGTPSPGPLEFQKVIEPVVIGLAARPDTSSRTTATTSSTCRICGSPGHSPSTASCSMRAHSRLRTSAPDRRPRLHSRRSGRAPTGTAGASTG
ncbi:hypothetical protein [Streptomyces sp. NPDC057257]|uniref:hypothetical protein n=1 Tax=Streptomyces sp. NPDC057257 TaxID=3346071 RepID=UPI003643FE49